VIVAGNLRDDILADTKAVAGVYAFDAKTGVPRWKWEIEERSTGHTIAGIAASGGNLFVWMEDRSKNLFGNTVLTAFDPVTGKQKWQHAGTTNLGEFPGPMLFGPNVVLSCDDPQGGDAAADRAGFVYSAFDAASGERLWQSQTNWKFRKAIAHRNRLIASERKVHQLLNENGESSPDSWVTLVDLRTGKELWRGQEIELGVLTTPAVGDDMVVVGSHPYSFNETKGKPEVAGLWAWHL
jgi:outer membrane protein assembly factor BamB